jgi:hypothetical protein
LLKEDIMRRFPISAAVLCAVLLLVTQGALAAKRPIAPRTVTSAVYPMAGSFDENMAGLVEIYSNLGPRNDVYDKAQGWLIGPRIWVGMPFRITADATIKQIKIAALAYGPSTGFTLELTEDSHGLPLGQVKHAWLITDLPPVRTCCTLKVANYSQGIKVQRGETYWIVTETRSSSGGGQWEYTWNHTMSNDIAVKAHPFRWVRYHGGVSAFAVYGTVP